MQTGGRPRAANGRFVRTGGSINRSAGLDPNIYEGGIYCTQFVQSPGSTDEDQGENVIVCNDQVRLVNATGSQIVASPWRIKVSGNKFDMQEMIGDPVSVPEGQERIVRFVKLPSKQAFNPFDPVGIYIVYGRTLDEVRPNPDNLTKFPPARPETSLKVGLIGSVTAKFLPPFQPSAPIPNNASVKFLPGVVRPAGPRPPIPIRPKPMSPAAAGGLRIRNAGGSMQKSPALINRLF